jgi:hypothetical protein
MTGIVSEFPVAAAFRPPSFFLGVKPIPTLIPHQPHRELCSLCDLCVKIPTLSYAMPSRNVLMFGRLAGLHSEVKPFRINVYASVDSK